MTLTEPDATAASRIGPALRELLAPPGPVEPYRHYTTLRELAPVYRSDFGICFVSSYDACVQALSGEDFAVQDPAWFDASTPGWRDHPATRMLYQGMQCRNPPDHTRMRRLLGGSFTSRRVAALTEHLELVTDRYLDGLADASSGGSPVDLVAGLATPLPVDVIGELLGVPEAERTHLSTIARRIFAIMDIGVTDAMRADAADAARALEDYWAAEVRRRRDGADDDIVGNLVAARGEGVISQEELMAILIFLFAAGFATTAALIGNATVELLRRPGLAARLRADPGLAPAVVEEALRFETPTQIDPRVVRRDTVLDGVPLARGQFVLAFLGAANRDPARFPDPDRFDVDRGRHPAVVSFGGGPHLCLGAPLARLEAQVVLPRLLRRFPRLALADEPRRVPSLRMRQFERITIRPAG